MPRSIPENLKAVHEKMARAAGEADRNVEDITLVAVSKKFDAERIRSALAAGHRVFGENRVQEAAGKWPELKADFPDVSLHLIGPLQTNKARDAVALFDVIESVDREKLARRLSREMAKQNRPLPCFVQVNTGEEPQKAGVFPESADDFIAFCRGECDLPVKGLMTLPPVDEDPAPHFALLRTIAERNGLPVLSMGMSGDFEAAIALGATHVRLGTAIFGPRPAPVP